MTAGQRLALHAYRAGYDRSILELLADLTLRRGPGEPLDDRALEQISVAVEVCAQAGYTAESLPLLADHACASAAPGEDWRARFWSKHVMPMANRRYLNSKFYGLSPCEIPSPPPQQLPAELLEFGRGGPH
jgi:hypothetical protein